jgi:aminopeptidase N
MRNRMRLLLSVFLFFLTAIPVSLEADELSLKDGKVHHDIKVVLSPAEHSLTAEDTITVPDHLLPEFHFFLHKGMNPISQTNGASVVKENSEKHDIIYESYRVKLPQGANTFMLKYGGIINHPLKQHGKEQARGYSHTAGIITEEGAYLEGSSFWYPVFDESFLTFVLQIEMPPDWDAVSQGERKLQSKDKSITRVCWESPEPQEEIFLVAARFSEYVKSSGRLQAMVFLRKPETGLAEKYLDATIRYIAMYEKLIGPYPYRKFALVENFWETGFGMPSFTLLGPKVIRFPFIINSSYPHEILHNWWGNSVYPDYSGGNWSEGLTAYLSDHLLKEQQGGGLEYRQTTLQKYTDYVFSGRDFALTEFRSRHSTSSEAIGYGKSLMFFHMLRQYLGDEVFLKGIREFYRDNLFKLAAFTGLRKSFERVSGKGLKEEFVQWTEKTGAPELKISDLKVKKENDKYILTAIIEQMQQEIVFHLRVPVAVTLKEQQAAYQTVVSISERRAEIKLDLPSRPLRIDVDPEFDLFRRLSRDEMPPAITQALGSKKMLVILPASAGKAMLKAYQEFAMALSSTGPDETEVKPDNEIKQLPSDQAVTVIGRENRFFKEFIPALSLYEVTMSDEWVRIGKDEIPFSNHSLILTARNPENKDMAMMFIHSDLPEALPGLGRKLPHYHKYSYLGFEGNEPVNTAKGRWPVMNSPMTVFIPGEDGKVDSVEMGELNQRKPLITLQPSFSAEEMIGTTGTLSGDILKGRGLGTSELDQAAEFIAQKFREAGLIAAGDAGGGYFQTWEEKDTGNPEHKLVLKNVVGVIPGTKPEWSDQSIVIGSHYDHLGLDSRGEILHGADDNASGVSVLIELAKVLGKTMKPERSVVFVAFTGEETGRKGSKHYIDKEKRYPAPKCIGMLNLDTVGRLGKNKLLVLGAGSAKEWIHIFKGAGHLSGVEIEAVSEELDSSDQKSFQEAGIPAVQLFTGPHPDYHKPTDTVDKIDAEGLVKVAAVAKEVIEYLAKREGPLDATLQLEQKSGSEPKKERKVSLGIIPDFAFSGKGCRLSGVVPGSPAEKAGLREGDIIIRLNATLINKLKDLSDILKTLKPGDSSSITFLRDGNETIVMTDVVER